jgi:hypothetical protein
VGIGWHDSIWGGLGWNRDGWVANAAEYYSSALRTFCFPPSRKKRETDGAASALPVPAVSKQPKVEPPAVVAANKNAGVLRLRRTFTS